MISVSVDAREVIDAAIALPHLRAPIVRAQVRAVNKTLTALRARAIREVAAANNLPQKVLKKGSGSHRGRVFLRNADPTQLSGSLWFGTKSIKAGYLFSKAQIARGLIHGRKRQRRAIRAHGHTFAAGSFIARMPSGHIGIFFRKEGAASRKADNLWKRTTLPIGERYVQLKEAANIVRTLRGYANTRLKTNLDAELNYELNVRGARR